MGQISMIFFEKFKDLEKTCNEIYGKTGGVTEYISEMEQTSRYDSERIPGWSSDLKELKRVRHIRNNMAHEASFDSAECTEEDVTFLKSFRDRILKTEDPLALKRKLKNPNLVPKKPDQIVKKPVLTNQVRTTTDNHPNVMPKERITEKNVYVKPKKGKRRIFLFVFIAACLAVGVYLVIRLDVFNRIKYSDYKTFRDSKEYQEIVSGSIDSIELQIKFEKPVTITDSKRIKEIVKQLDTMSFTFVSSSDIKNTIWDSSDIILNRGGKKFRIGITFYKYDYMYLFTDKRLYCYKFDREMTEVTDIFPWFTKREDSAGNNVETDADLDSSDDNLYLLYDLGDMDMRNHFISLPESAKAGETVEIKTEVLMDADIYLFVEGTEIKKTHSDSDYWGYTFVMPDHGVKVTAKPSLIKEKDTSFYAGYSAEDRNIAEAYYPDGYEGYYYPALPLMSTWPYGNHQTMINACQIPEDILKDMPTGQLVQTVMAYPLWGDVLAYDSREMAYGLIKGSFNGLRELYSREDAAEYLEKCPDTVRLKFGVAFFTMNEYFGKDTEESR